MLLCLTLPALVSSRLIFGRIMGSNCTVRVQQRECVTNPMFMDKDCADECNHLTFVDINPRHCVRQKHICFAQKESVRENFIFNECNKTCRHRYRTIERILAPSDLQVLIHAMLPTVYSLTLVALVCYQLLIRKSNTLMLMLERLKQSGSFTSLAERGQAALIFLCDNQEKIGGFGPNAVGRLFVCGYFLVEGGYIFGMMAVLVYIGPPNSPKLLNYCTMMIFFYSFAEAIFTVIKGLVLSRTSEEVLEEHHVIIDAELMTKKLAMFGVSMLFLQSSSVIGRAQKASVLGTTGTDEERSGTHEGLLLFGRLFMALGFCFVAFWETNRLMQGKVHDPPDGHDILWPKVVQLLLVVPFILGFKTNAVTQLLALSLVLEAMTVWHFWHEMYSDMPSMFHALHSKDHFATNVAVAGGLFLLQEEGGGKYTLDAYMKKKD